MKDDDKEYVDSHSYEKHVDMERKSSSVINAENHDNVYKVYAGKKHLLGQIYLGWKADTVEKAMRIMGNRPKRDRNGTLYYEGESGRHRADCLRVVIGPREEEEESVDPLEYAAHVDLETGRAGVTAELLKRHYKAEDIPWMLEHFGFNRRFLARENLTRHGGNTKYRWATAVEEDEAERKVKEDKTPPMSNKRYETFEYRCHYKWEHWTIRKRLYYGVVAELVAHRGWKLSAAKLAVRNSGLLEFCDRMGKEGEWVIYHQDGNEDYADEIEQQREDIAPYLIQTDDN